LLSTPKDASQSNRTLMIAGIIVVVTTIAVVASVRVYILYTLGVPVPRYVFDSVVYASLFGLMATGLTLTYLTTKVPNFAYGSFVTIGIYASFTLYKLDNLNPYLSTPIAFLLGGASSVVMYLGVLRVLARRGSSLVALMISTLAVDIAFVGIFGIYTDHLYYNYRLFDVKSFYQLGGDFELFGTPGLAFVAPISLGVITAAIFILLTQTKFGIAMRASVENPSLARVLGIDVEKTYLFAWFLAGGFAALSGAFYTLWLPGAVNSGSNLIVEIFSASVLGGLASIYGAVLGGLIIGASEILVTDAGVQLFGSWVLIYQKGIPLVIMVITLLFMPQGLVSVDWLHLPRNIALTATKTVRRITRGR
jgi:branched-chain amino acid transport system permease protein